MFCPRASSISIVTMFSLLLVGLSGCSRYLCDCPSGGTVCLGEPLIGQPTCCQTVSRVVQLDPPTGACVCDPCCMKTNRQTLCCDNSRTYWYTLTPAPGPLTPAPVVESPAVPVEPIPFMPTPASRPAPGANAPHSPIEDMLSIPQPLPKPPEAQAPVVPSGQAPQTPPAQRKVIEASALRLEAFDLTDAVAEGQEMEYLLRVTNQGTLPARALCLSAECPRELQPVGITGTAPEAIQGQTVNLPTFDLSPGQSRTFRLTLRAVGPGDVRMRITLTGQELDSPVVEEESTTIYQPG